MELTSTAKQEMLLYRFRRLLIVVPPVQAEYWSICAKVLARDKKAFDRYVNRSLKQFG